MEGDNDKIGWCHSDDEDVNDENDDDDDDENDDDDEDWLIDHS